MTDRPDLETRADPRFGFRRLAEQPANDQVERYFREEYYGAILRGEKSVDIKRSMEGGPEARRQAAWMANTLYADIAHILDSLAPGRRVLEVGCGLGDLLEDLSNRGFDVSGVEIAEPAARHAQARGLDVHLGAFGDLASGDLREARYDAVMFINVLEQIPDVETVLATARSLLTPGGLLVVRAGNDFNPMQQIIAKELGHGDYWVVPDHLYYFDFDSLDRLFTSLGRTTVYRQGDFPMELMPLLGMDFLADPAIGKQAHEARVRLEEYLPPDLRRRLYHALGEAGFGRCLLMAARQEAPRP